MLRCCILQKSGPMDPQSTAGDQNAPAAAAAADGKYTAVMLRFKIKSMTMRL